HAIQYRSTSADMLGFINVRTPMAIPTRPPRNAPQGNEPTRGPNNAQATVNAPSTSTKAPKIRIKEARVAPGHIKATRPNRIARTPLRATAHQFRTSVSNILTSLHVPVQLPINESAIDSFSRILVSSTRA